MRGRRPTTSPLHTVCAALLLMVSLPGLTLLTHQTALAVAVGDSSPTVETAPVANAGDAADDPAIWVHPTNPARSVVIGNNKLGALEVYDLNGQRIQRITEGFFGNVDVRQGVTIGGRRVDLVVVYRKGIRVYTIDPTTRQLSNITDAAGGSISSSIGGEGLCLYTSPNNGSTYAIVIARDGRVAQHELLDNDGDGRIEGQLRRTWSIGSEAEGCVADDTDGSLYISEERVGIWKYPADPNAAATSNSRQVVDRLVGRGGHILADAEGLTIVYAPGGVRYLIASSQAASNTRNSFVVYRLGTNAFVGSFKVVGGSAGDGCGRTDGIDAVTANLGPAFPNGMFVCQDGTNTAPAGGNQNFKLVPLHRVLSLP
jgi:3-phytase